MLHLELLPGWFAIAVSVAAAAVLLLIAYTIVRDRRRRATRRARRAKNMAHRRAWEWLRDAPGPKRIADMRATELE